jgi:hypothetical protein
MASIELTRTSPPWLSKSIGTASSERVGSIPLPGEVEKQVVTTASVVTPPTPDVRSDRTRSRHKKALTIAVVLLLLGGSTAGYLISRGPGRQERYLSALTAANIRQQFPTDRVATGNAQRVCKDLESGKPAQGYMRDRVGVQLYCPDFLPGFVVVPTPEEQRDSYLSSLRDAGLAGKFPSDEAAVAHAKALCSALDGGGAQQGMPEDRLGVQVYCAKFLDGFKTLRVVTVKGTFALYDSAPGVYYPAIASAGGSCTGANGYSDIGPGTIVSIKNGSGKILGQDSLGRGSGSRTRCEFAFSIEVTEGEDTYQVEASHRGTITYTFTQLATQGIQLSLGS